MAHENPAAGQSARRFDVDWLRVLAILGIFFFHCTRFFDNGEAWHIKNSVLTGDFLIPTAILGIWGMPLFWVLSGQATYFALAGRSARAFVRARVLRLAVPLITVGWFVLSPPQVYVERVTAMNYNAPPFSGSFLDFLPHYFEGIYGMGGSFAFTGVHLWYLYWLFVFSMAMLPLFVELASPSGRKLSWHLAALVEKPGAIFLPALLAAAPELVLQPHTDLGSQEGGYFLLTYLVLLILGFMIASDGRIERAVERQKGVALFLAGLSTVFLAVWVLTDVPTWFGPAAPPMLAIAHGSSCWFWLLAVLGFGRKYLSFYHPVLAYAGEAALPFYILHQPVIVVIGFFIRDWPLSIPAKYILLAATAFAVIMVLYEFAIRRVKLLRFVFGLKIRPGSRMAAEPSRA